MLKCFLMSLWEMWSEFLPAAVSEAEGHRHLREGSNSGHEWDVKKGSSALIPARILLILAPPLPRLLLSDQQGGSQSLAQELTDLDGLLPSIFHSWDTSAPPRVQTDAQRFESVVFSNAVLVGFILYTWLHWGIRDCGRTVAFPRKHSCPASPAGRNTLAPSPQNRRKWPKPARNISHSVHRSNVGV